MVKIEISLVINRPVEEVFAFVSNYENLPRWRSIALEVRKTSEGPSRVGTSYTGKFSFLGLPFDAVFEVIEHEPSRKCTIKTTTRPFPLETRYSFEPVENATRITLVSEGSPGAFFKLAEPLVASMGKRLFEADLHNLKELLEAQAL
ncbi:hypothetical protein D3879_03500 [Pseudomonas cavernicola]|uniref:Polyketide cyclase n=1 Tax=Pseudomonas cavernicola TaxID=2320866 RepID=A0A418XIQ8_9PSED|nr:SRPBCC family protein [Pseudomonas cavernicola]RJG12373.1 hypothetical protein D3879_03500 [Pseudomonas cavernicola]